MQNAFFEKRARTIQEVKEIELRGSRPDDLTISSLPLLTVSNFTSIFFTAVFALV